MHPLLQEFLARPENVYQWQCLGRCTLENTGVEEMRMIWLPGAGSNLLKPATSGTVTGTTHPVHIGRSTQVWEIHIKKRQ